VIVKKMIMVVPRRLAWPLDYAGFRLPDWKRPCGILLKKLWMDIQEYRIFHQKRINPYISSSG